MSQNTERRLIESDTFGNLLPEIDKKAAKEKGSGGRPVYWKIIFWSTRKPLISARAFTAAALLPENYPLDKFERMTRLSEDLPHKYQPIVNSEFKNFTILDPFAGFGSIPLEAKRLKVGKVIASELLPTAYVFLKAVLEYPKYGTKLLDDLKKYGKELIKSIEDDVKELYGEYSGLVGTWEVKCPHCGNYTPLVNQWWLLALEGRKKKEEGESEEKVKSGNFKRLVFMKPEVSGKQLRIKIIDLNKELNRKTIPAKKTKDRVIIDGKEYRVPEGNVNAKHSYAKCLFCNTTFPGKGGKWYVKEAIKDWSEMYEKYLNGEISLEELRNAKARPTLLVKFKGERKDLVFEETNEDDMKKFWESFEKLRNIDISNIPTESVASYASRRTTVAWGMDKFYKLFDARQLIIFSKIIAKLNELRERIKGDEEYKEAIITYLTIAFLNHIRHNCMVTSVHPSRTFIRDALAPRGFSLTWNWVEISPLANIIGSLSRSLDHVVEGLKYLMQTNTDSRIEIINSDVNELTLSDKVDVIVTDPPYADDVPYPEVGDFYYVWLKRIIPFPYKTLWEEFVPKDIGVDEERSKVFGDNIGSYEYFRNKLAQAFNKLAEILKDDGLLITFYNHTSPDAWISLLYAGWYVSKFRITTTHAIKTEDETRLTARATITLDKSIVIVWRKRAEGSKLIHEIRKEAISKVSDWVSSMLSNQKLKLSTDTYIEVLGKVLSVFTQYEKVLGLRGEGIDAVEDLVTNYVFPTTAQAIIEGLSKGIGVRISDPYAVYYVLVKLLIPPSTKGVRKLDSNTLTFLNISSGSLDVKDLQSKGVIRVEGKNNTIALVEPEQNKDIIAALEQLPEVKMVLQGNYNFSNPVQVFHYLEYVSLKYSDKLKDEIEKLRERTRFVDEALAIAKVFARVLPDNDIEKEPSKRLSGDKVGIERWFNG